MAERGEVREDVEQWRWAVRRDLDQLAGKMEHLHSCFERRDETLQDLVQRLATRVTMLENLRQQILGAIKVASVVVLALLPLVWWVLTRLIPVISTVLDKKV